MNNPREEDIVKLKPLSIDGAHQYVALDFSGFGKNEQSARMAFDEYMSALVVESEALVRQTAVRFFEITHCSALEIRELTQALWDGLPRK